MPQKLFIYLIIINIFSFFLFGIDKWKAKHRKWRISEAALLSSAVIGGSLGALLAMFLFRHKTRHYKFTFGVPLILAAQIASFLVLRGKLF